MITRGGCRFRKCGGSLRGLRRCRCPLRITNIRHKMNDFNQKSMYIRTKTFITRNNNNKDYLHFPGYLSTNVRAVRSTKNKNSFRCRSVHSSVHSHSPTSLPPQDDDDGVSIRIQSESSHRDLEVLHSHLFFILRRTSSINKAHTKQM